MRSAKLLPILGIAATPLLLAMLGVTHPQVLTPETAPYWHTLHLILLALFPLLGVNLTCGGCCRASQAGWCGLRKR